MKLTGDSHIAVLGDSNKKVKMYLREIDKGHKKKITYTKGSTLFGIFKDYEMRQMQTLHEIVGNDAEYDLIKQDVQGAEIMLITLIEFTLGPVWVWLAFNEQPTIKALLGGSLVLAAVAGRKSPCNSSYLYLASSTLLHPNCGDSL